MTHPGIPNSAYLHTDPITDIEFLEVPEVHTVIANFTDHPMTDMASAFDATFRALFPALAAHGLTPAGPAFALHYRMPTDTATFEVGVPVNAALDNEFTTDAGVTLTPSTLPAGSVARVSHLGPYERLGESWGTFMQSIAASGTQPSLPFWEVYVTEPTPDTDPATLRTDLYSRLAD